MSNVSWHTRHGYPEAQLIDVRLTVTHSEYGFWWRAEILTDGYTAEVRPRRSCATEQEAKQVAERIGLALDKFNWWEVEDAEGKY